MSVNDYKNYKKAKQVAQALVDRVNAGDDNSNQELLDELCAGDIDLQEMISTMSDEKNVDKCFAELREIDNKHEVNARRLLADAAQRRKSHRKIASWRRLSAIWAVAAVLVAAVLIYNLTKQPDPLHDKIIVNSGGCSPETHVKLILSSGESVLLENNSKSITDNGLTVNNKDNTLNYTTPSSAQKYVAPIYHTVITPKGETFDITLSDGTIVTLNANSTLKYQANFTDSSRAVELSGEAFFRVAKSPVPFIVKSGDVDIKVYGTQFNVSTNIKNRVVTSLVEGSVGIKKRGSQEVMLTPNNTAKIDCTSGNVVINRGVSAQIAWLSGNFMFDDCDFETMLNDLSAWYGVEFCYSDHLFDGVTLNAAFSRSVNIDKILKSIVDIMDVEFIRISDTRYDIAKTK